MTFYHACLIIKSMKNIVLIGMPSSGKSTVGKLLAKKLSYTFCDGDDLIRAQQNKPLNELIARHGAEGFIKIEEDVNCSVDFTNTVFATGGSAVYSPRAMAHLKEIGTIIYLAIGEEEVGRRIPSLELRGVVMRGNVKTVSDLYRERKPLYEKYADITLDCHNKDAGQISDEIVKNALRAKP